MSEQYPSLPSEAQPPPQATTLWLIRHAEVEAKYQRVFGGRIDMDLSPCGRTQSLALAAYLKPRQFAAVYASPMRRVRQTLALLQANSLPRPTFIEGFREVDFGDWTGLSWAEVLERFKVSAFSWLDQLECGGIPNCETTASLRLRVEPALQEIVSRHAGRQVAVFCHGGVIRIILSILLGLPAPKLAAFEIDYTSVTQVSCLPGRNRLELLNFTPWRDLNA
jgi:broad specificity phosphatase PhoE